MTTPWKVLVVDDDEGIHSITRMVFRGYKFQKRPIELINASSGVQAKKILSEHNDIAVTILDVVMEEDDEGLDLVTFIREQLNNRDIRIILRTGYPGFAPEAEVIVEHDINDYLSKAEVSASRLITSVVVALRSYRDIQSVKKTPAVRNLQYNLKSKKITHPEQLLVEISEKFNATLQPLKRRSKKLQHFSHQPMIDDLVKGIDSHCEKLEGLNSLLRPLIQTKKSTINIAEELARITKNYLSQAKTDDWIIDYTISPDFPEQLTIDANWLSELIITQLEIALAISNRSDLGINLSITDQRLKLEFKGNDATKPDTSQWLLLLQEKLASFCSFNNGRVEAKKQGIITGFSFKL